MSDAKNTNATIFAGDQKTELARIVLNGYNIAAGGPLGLSGALRSFKLLNGDLYPAWINGSQLVVRSEDGRTAAVRIAAYPADKGASGFIEFLPE